jgi:phosphoribosylformylglycinamidine synthase subunit PurS
VTKIVAVAGASWPCTGGSGRVGAGVPAGSLSGVSLHKVVVDVMLKPEILDPAGQAVSNALPSLGFAPAAGLRIGKHVELELEAADGEEALTQATKIAETLLANPVIEDFAVRLA